MHITLFSFVTAVLLSSLLIVALYLSRKSVKTIRMLNFGLLRVSLNAEETVTVFPALFFYPKAGGRRLKH